MYERLIKDIKKTLYKTLGKTLLKPGQLEAVIMDIERHLNNRPLTYVESDIGEEQVLTPNIIWGKNSYIIEELEVENVQKNEKCKTACLVTMEQGICQQSNGVSSYE